MEQNKRGTGVTIAEKQKKFFTPIHDGDHTNVSGDTLDIRKLKTTMIERAWNDLSPSAEIEPKDRRSAIQWFRGLGESVDYVFSFKACLEVLGGLKKSQARKLEQRLQIAEKCRAAKPVLIELDGEKFIKV